MSQVHQPEKRTYSILEVRTTSRYGKDWSLVIWPNFSSTSSRDFVKITKLLYFSCQTRLSHPGQPGLRAELLRQVGEAHLFSQKTFLHAIFPLRSTMLLAAHLLRRSYKCDEFRPSSPIACPTPPRNYSPGYWIFPDKSPHWHGPKFRIEEFLDDVEEEIFGIRVAQRSWDDPVEETGLRSPMDRLEKSPQHTESPTVKPKALQVAHQHCPMTPVSGEPTTPRKRKWVWSSSSSEDNEGSEEIRLRTPPPTPSPHGNVGHTFEETSDGQTIEKVRILDSEVE